MRHTGKVGQGPSAEVCFATADLYGLVYFIIFALGYFFSFLVYPLKLAECGFLSLLYKVSAEPLIRGLILLYKS